MSHRSPLSFVYIGIVSALFFCAPFPTARAAAPFVENPLGYFAPACKTAGGNLINVTLPGCGGDKKSSLSDLTKPSITIIAPNGGEKLTAGSSYKFRWYTTSVPASRPVILFMLEVASSTGAVTKAALLGGVKTTNTGALTFDVPDVIDAYSFAGKTFVIVGCVLDTAGTLCETTDRSNAAFTVTEGAVAAPPATEIQRLVSLEVSNETPGPYTNIFFTLVSYDVDLDRSPITWFVNGKAVKSGVGEKVLTAKTGANGEALAVRAEIVASGKTIVKERTIIPGEVDILWEALDSYTPPFYKGKALPGSEATIRAVAIPHLANTDPTTAVYQWKLDDKYAPFADQSGYVKRIVTFIGDFLNKNQPLEVVASSFDKTVAGRGVDVVSQREPLIRFYEKHPTYGILYEKTLADDTMITGGEMTVVAEPFYFSTPSRNSSLSYTWNINGSAVSPAGKTPSTIVARNAGAAGDFDLSVSVEKPISVFQRAEAQVRLRSDGSGGSASGSPFGPFGQ